MVTVRTPLLAGNWKMNLDHLQAIAFVQKLAWTLKDAHHDYTKAEVAVFPPLGSRLRCPYRGGLRGVSGQA
jgi:triosephosphate isomerase (TIM)